MSTSESPQDDDVPRTTTNTKRKRDIGVQRAFRARKAAHLADLETRVALAELENARLLRENRELVEENQHLRSRLNSQLVPERPASLAAIVDQSGKCSESFTSASQCEASMKRQCSLPSSDIKANTIRSAVERANVGDSSAPTAALGVIAAISPGEEDIDHSPAAPSILQRVVCCNDLFPCKDGETTWASNSTVTTSNTINDLLALLGDAEGLQGSPAT